MRDEPNGVLRDYTGWARLRLSYVDPNDSSKNQKVKADEAADGVKVVIRCEDRRLLVCPACLETSGLLTAKYYVNKYEGKGPERVDPDPEGSLCEHKAERGKCLVKGCINIVPCKDKHYPGVVCGTCGMVLSSDDDYAEEEPAQTSTPGCVTFACKEKHYPGVACGVCGVMGPHYGSSICKLHVDNWRGSCDLCKKLCDGHSVRPCAVNSVNKKACGHYDESGSFSP
jgi:hypothetical protein